MKRLIITGMVLGILLTVYAAQKGETKVDSIVYDTGMEWKVFNTNGPVLAFTVLAGNLWVATEQDLTMMNTQAKRAELQTFAKVGNLAAAGITTLSTDSSGNIWAGTKEGAAQKTKTAWVNYTADNGLTSNAITVIATSPDGTVWVGTEAGLNAFKAGSWKTFKTAQGLVSEKINCISFDNRNNVWIGTTKGISVYDGNKFTTHSMKNGMSWNDTKAFGFDPRTNVMWAAVGDQDVNTYDGKGWNTYMNIQMGIRSIMVDTQSRVWFGYDQGVIKFNGDEWISDAAKHGIPAVMVTQMYRDGKGNLYFASQNGVIFLNNPYPY
jgi:ligand-binding sensor domain-containing protein